MMVAASVNDGVCENEIACERPRPKAAALERARREEATLSLLDHSFGDG